MWSLKFNVFELLIENPAQVCAFEACGIAISSFFPSLYFREATTDAKKKGFDFNGCNFSLFSCFCDLAFAHIDNFLCPTGQKIKPFSDILPFIKHGQQGKGKEDSTKVWWREIGTVMKRGRKGR